MDTETLAKLESLDNMKDDKLQKMIKQYVNRDIKDYPKYQLITFVNKLKANHLDECVEQVCREVHQACIDVLDNLKASGTDLEEEGGLQNLTLLALQESLKTLPSDIQEELSFSIDEFRRDYADALIEHKEQEELRR